MGHWIPGQARDAIIMKAACVQMTSGPDVDENIATASAFIREAAGQGADFIATPEMTDSIRRYAKDKIANPGDAAVAHFAALAAELNITLLIGSLGISSKSSLHGSSVQSISPNVDHTDPKKEGPCDDDRKERLFNRSFLFAPNGKEIAHYDKIHMFDVKLSRTEFYNESKEYEAGERAVVADCKLASSPCDLIAGSSQSSRDPAVKPQDDSFRVGMGVCYDLRFPHLWRDLAKQGADILTAPAAFTVPTGKAHWEILLRARAIETGCYVIAPAQIGEHEGGRLTYGHSMIVNPWGEILVERQEGTGIITADIELNEVQNARNAIPALAHDRDYTLNLEHEQENL